MSAVQDTTKQSAMAPGFLLIRFNKRLYMHVTRFAQTEDGAKEQWLRYEQLVGEERCTLLMNLGGIFPTGKAWEYFKPKLNRGRPFLATALVTKSPAAKILASILKSIVQWETPLKIFSEISSAERWLSSVDAEPSHLDAFQAEVESINAAYQTIRSPFFQVRVDPTRLVMEIDIDSENKITEKEARELLEIGSQWHSQLGKSLLVLVSSHSSVVRSSISTLSVFRGVKFVRKLAIVKPDRRAAALTRFVYALLGKTFPIRLFSSKQDAMLWLLDSTDSLLSEHINEDRLTPLYEGLTAIAEGQLSSRIATDSIQDESVLAIAAAINKMADELQNSFLSKNILESKNIFYDQILNKIPIGIVISKRNDLKENLFFNTEAKRILPQLKQIEPKPKEEFMALSKQIFHESHSESFFGPFKRTDANGKEIQVQFKLLSIAFENSSQEDFNSLVIVEDISNQVELEKSRKAMELAAFNSARMAHLGEVTSGITHEINNPLTIIQGKALSIKHQIENDLIADSKEKIVSNLDAILNTTERINKIISGMRTVSRDASRDEMEPTPLRKIVQDASAIFTDRFKANSIDFKICGLEDSLIVECREAEITQILVNLLGNAEYAVMNRKDAETVPGSISIEIETSDGQILIAVSDNGQGFSGDAKKHFAVPFFTTKPVGKGTGLGLAISHGIAHAHQGTLKIDRASSPTRIVLQIPVQQNKVTKMPKDTS